MTDTWDYAQGCKRNVSFSIRRNLIAETIYSS